MYKLYDFKCEECGAVIERLDDETVFEIECYDCGGPAKRMLPLIADRNITWAKECRMPGRYCKLPPHREERQKMARKRLEERGAI